MRYTRKLNKYERREDLKVRKTEALKGTGKYVFKNNTSGTLKLPKPALDGRLNIPKDGTFEGDSYFMSYVPTLLRFINEITEIKENEMEEQKLILDQPNKITNQGTVEQVMTKEKQILIEQPAKGDVLLNEDPMAGIEIIND